MIEEDKIVERRKISVMQFPVEEICKVAKDLNIVPLGTETSVIIEYLLTLSLKNPRVYGVIIDAVSIYDACCRGERLM